MQRRRTGERFTAEGTANRTSDGVFRYSGVARLDTDRSTVFCIEGEGIVGTPTQQTTKHSNGRNQQKATVIYNISSSSDVNINICSSSDDQRASSLGRSTPRTHSQTPSTSGPSNTSVQRQRTRRALPGRIQRGPPKQTKPPRGERPKGNGSRPPRTPRPAKAEGRRVQRRPTDSRSSSGSGRSVEQTRRSDQHTRASATLVTHSQRRSSPSLVDDDRTAVAATPERADTSGDDDQGYNRLQAAINAGRVAVGRGHHRRSRSVTPLSLSRASTPEERSGKDTGFDRLQAAIKSGRVVVGRGHAMDRRTGPNSTPDGGTRQHTGDDQRASSLGRSTPRTHSQTPSTSGPSNTSVQRQRTRRALPGRIQRGPPKQTKPPRGERPKGNGSRPPRTPRPAKAEGRRVQRRPTDSRSSSGSGRSVEQTRRSDQHTRASATLVTHSQRRSSPSLVDDDRTAVAATPERADTSGDDDQGYNRLQAAINAGRVAVGRGHHRRSRSVTPLSLSRASTPEERSGKDTGFDRLQAAIKSGRVVVGRGHAMDRRTGPNSTPDGGTRQHTGSVSACRPVRPTRSPYSSPLRHPASSQRHLTPARRRVALSVAAIRRRAKLRLPRTQFGTLAGVQLTAIVEYLCAELLETSGATTKQDGRRVVQPRHMRHAIRADGELSALCRDAVISN